MLSTPHNEQESNSQLGIGRYRAHHTIVNSGQFDFSLSWFKGEVRENLGDFRKSIQILTLLSPLPHVSLPFTKMNVLLYDLKKDAINEFGINYWISNPVWVTFQEHGSSFYVNIEEKVWLLEKKILTGRLKLRFLTEIGRFHWNQGEEVAHFAWFGEPCHGFKPWST